MNKGGFGGGQRTQADVAQAVAQSTFKANLDLDKGSAYGQFILIERIVQKSEVLELLKAINCTMSRVRSVGAWVVGDIRPGDDVVFSSGQGLGQDGLEGGQLAMIAEQSVFWHETNDGRPSGQKKSVHRAIDAALVKAGQMSEEQIASVVAAIEKATQEITNGTKTATQGGTT